MGKAAGAEFGSNFYCVRGPELLDKYIGASEKAVRELFIQISDSGKPGLLFFDEFESLAPKRGKDNTGVTDRIVNQLLTFIDGVEATMSSSNNGSQVYIVAATSRPDLIDAALLRPGRIEKHIYIGLPTVEDRISIVKELLRTLNVAPGIDATIVEIAHHTKATLMTPADWKAVVSTAYLLATHEYINIHYSSLAETQESRLTYRKREHRSLEKHRDSDTFISDYRETYNEDISPNRKLSTPVVIIEENLMAAFHQTKPSISAQDLQFYSSIYQKFGGKAAAASSKSPTKVEDRNQQRMSFK